MQQIFSTPVSLNSAAGFSAKNGQGRSRSSLGLCEGLRLVPLSHI